MRTTGNNFRRWYNVEVQTDAVDRYGKPVFKAIVVREILKRLAYHKLREYMQQTPGKIVARVVMYEESRKVIETRTRK